MDDRRVAIPGSNLKHADDACWSPAPCEARIGVTIYVRRRGDDSDSRTVAEDLLSGRFQPVSREEEAARFGASPQDLEAVCSFAEKHDLRVTNENAAARTVRVEGTVGQMGSAFQVNIGMVEGANGECLSYEGTLTLPASLASVVVAVLGLDQRPVAKPGAQRDAS